jgi:putative transposase
MILNNKQNSVDKSIAWPHAPSHRLSEPGTYFVTSGTHQKRHHFSDNARLGVLHRGLLSVSRDAGWDLEAWAVFPNHYHFIAHSPQGADGATGLSAMLAELHKKTAKWVNGLDDAIGRQVWHNFWETKLTYEKSYLARLNYCHQNAVSHGVVPVANQYPWCSAAWFERTATPAQVETIYRFPVDDLNVKDDYDVCIDA